MSDKTVDRSAEHVWRVGEAMNVIDRIGWGDIALRAIELGAVVPPPEKPKSKVREAIERLDAAFADYRRRYVILDPAVVERDNAFLAALKALAEEGEGKAQATAEPKP